jgi:hypothetical protein
MSRLLRRNVTGAVAGFRLNSYRDDVAVCLNFDSNFVKPVTRKTIGRHVMSDIVPLEMTPSLRQLSPAEWTRLLRLIACLEALPEDEERHVWSARLLSERPDEAVLLAKFSALHICAMAAGYLRQPAANAARTRECLDAMSRFLRANV